MPVHHCRKTAGVPVFLLVEKQSKIWGTTKRMRTIEEQEKLEALTQEEDLS